MALAPSQSFRMNLTGTVEAARRDLANYQKRQLPTATQRALNRTLDFAATTTKRVMTKYIGISNAAIGRRLQKIKAPPQGTKVTMIVRGDRVPSIASFKHRKPAKSIKGKKRLAGKGVSARVWDKSKVYPGSFIWDRGRSSIAFKRVKGAAKIEPKKGNRYRVKRGGVYGKKAGHPYRLRRGDIIKRQPVEVVYGADIAQVFLSSPRKGAPIDKINAAVGPEFKKRLDHEITRIRRT